MPRASLPQQQREQERAQANSMARLVGQLLERHGNPDTDPNLMLGTLAMLRIREKSGHEAAFLANPVQRHTLDQIMKLPRDRQRRVLILKARQLGMSTLIQGWMYAMVRSVANMRAATISHEAEASTRLLDIGRYFLDHDPAQPETKQNRAGAVVFAGLESSHYVGTAGARAFGRGDTLHLIHASEVAFWLDAQKTLTGLMEALVPRGIGFIESTPNGIGGYFYETWQGAPENGWLPLFYPWWWAAEYRLPVLEPEEFQVLTDEEKFLVANFNLGLEQLAWRRDKMRQLRHHFAQEYPENAVDCFLTSGQPYFDVNTLREIEKLTVMPPIRESAGLRVWKDPEADHSYVVAGDPAEGLEGGDYSSCQVLDVGTGEQVAKLRGQWPADHFARLACQLAEKYNEALLTFERNNHGHSCLNTAVNTVGYQNLYRHEEYSFGMGEMQKKLGWPTNATTKPVMLADLDSNLIHGGVIIRDAQTLSELRTMFWNGKGGVEAVEGCHDDDVMALAIANQIRKMPARYQRSIDYFNLQRPEVIAGGIA
jgi:hypothetical protein